MEEESDEVEDLDEEEDSPLPAKCGTIMYSSPE